MVGQLGGRSVGLEMLTRLICRAVFRLHIPGKLILCALEIFPILFYFGGVFLLLFFSPSLSRHDRYENFPPLSAA